jgi:hypothetical protein
MLLEADGTADRDFGTMEMAFVYGVVTLALDGSDVRDGLINGGDADERVAMLLSQAGYEVSKVYGDRRGICHGWLEVGQPNHLPELIVDISTPDRPHDTVLRKDSRTGRAYSHSQERARNPQR